MMGAVAHLLATHFFFAAFAGSLKLNFRSLPVSAGQRNLRPVRLS